MQFLKQVENNGYVALSKNVIHNETWTRNHFFSLKWSFTAGLGLSMS